jgi:hypothetical protein
LDTNSVPASNALAVAAALAKAGLMYEYAGAPEAFAAAGI